VPASTALKVRQTLEAAGVEFTNEGQPGGETEESEAIRAARRPRRRIGFAPYDASTYRIIL
jgi:hypothetical protein